MKYGINLTIEAGCNISTDNVIVGDNCNIKVGQ